MSMRCLLCTLTSAVIFSLIVNFVYAQSESPAPSPAPLPDLSAPAAPSPAPTPGTPQPRRKIVYKEKSYYDFEDTLINGNVRKPDGSFIYRKQQNTFSSALNLRRSFIPELKESSHDAR